MGQFLVAPIPFFKLTAAIIAADGGYVNYYNMVKMVDVGGNLLPDNPCFFFDFTNTGTELVDREAFLRASSIGTPAMTALGMEQDVAANSFQPAFYEYTKGVVGPMAYQQDIAAGTQREVAKPTFRIFQRLNDEPYPLRWVPIPYATRMLIGETYRFVWSFPLANYVNQATFDLWPDMDGTIQLEFDSVWSSIPDYPALKKKIAFQGS